MGIEEEVSKASNARHLKPAHQDITAQIHGAMVRRADYVALLSGLALVAAGLFGFLPLWLGLSALAAELAYPLLAKRVIELSVNGEKPWHRFTATAMEILLPLARLGAVGYGIGSVL